MISISGNQSLKQASDYYAKENYYQKNSEIGYFYGKGLEELGIERGTPITAEVWENLLRGIDPNTKKGLVRNYKSKDRRAGFDVTFSAPKSVSVLVEYLEANGDLEKANKIRKAHSEANNKAMKYIEKNYTRTRAKLKNSITDKDVDLIKTNGLMYASFQHDTARITEYGDIDPQLHNHNFIFNVVTYRDGGKIKTATLSNEEIYRNKMMLGLNYRTELSANLQKLGIEIEITNSKEAFFEVKGFSKEQLDEFSGRSEAIKRKLKELKEKYPNINESKLKEQIVQKYKSKKKKVNREELYEKNNDRLDKVKINKDLIEKEILKNFGDGRDIRTMPSNEEISRDIFNSAEVVTDKQSVFTKEDVLKEAMKYGISRGITLSTYEKNFIEVNEEIVKLDNNNYSTVSMIDAEYRILEATVNSEKNKEEPYISLNNKKKEIENFIDKNYSTMTEGQRIMTETILTDDNKYIAVQGDAGVGKTFSAKAINEIMENTNPDIELVGLAFTGKASEGLENQSGIKSFTLDSFLYSEETRKNNGRERNKRLLIVDEAGMAGSKHIAKLIKIADESSDRIIFMGDTKQFASISAGQAFKDMQENGMKLICVSETLRQKTEHTKELVKSIKDKDPVKTFEILDSRKAFIESPKEVSVVEIAKEYRESPDNNKPLIISSRNDNRKQLNEIIRSNLKKDLKLKDGVFLKTMEQINSLEGASAEYGGSYGKGTILALNRLSGFKNGEKVEVLGRVEGTHSELKVKTLKGIEKKLDLKNTRGKITAFNSSEKEFSDGDRIIFIKNIQTQSLRVKNGQLATIEKVDKNGNIRLSTGKEFNIKENPFIEHGYAITDVKSQGMTTNKIIVLADSKMANYNSLYTQVTRAKYDVKIWTDNKNILRENITKVQLKKTTLDFAETLKKDNNGTNGKDTRKTGEHREQIKRDGEIKSATPKPDNTVKKGQPANKRTFKRVGGDDRHRRRERILDRSVKRNINSFRKVIGSKINVIETVLNKLTEKIKQKKGDLKSRLSEKLSKKENEKKSIYERLKENSSTKGKIEKTKEKENEKTR